ncbi:MAG TPA: bifunctional oligoribonuclease/PAP phosphatase NrnA [Gemmatimonadota bacterium]|nr:bifunctional oligoribonuclease/PAP phosphatase NrnA [Gemmatimonadota bacterium]
MAEDRGERRPVSAPGRERRAALEDVREALERSHRVVLTTHVNADGDGAGSELAAALHLEEMGCEVAIVNPTPFPDAFGFLLGDRPAWTPEDREGRRALEDADTVLVLDTSETSRLGAVADRLDTLKILVIDHHPPTPDAIGETVVLDPSACATGELVYDLLTLDGGRPGVREARALYVAIVTDTGSFRFGNTTPRAHAVAAELLRAGVDVEDMFRHLFARYTSHGLDLLERALATLEVDEDHALAWVSIRASDVEETGASAEDREGLVEYPRRLQGTEVAVLFRELARGRTKISLRSNGPIDVAAVARDFGGGGHRQAAGALVERPLAEVREAVVERLREAARET